MTAVRPITKKKVAKEIARLETRTPPLAEIKAPLDAFTHLDEAAGVAAHVATFHGRATIYVDPSLPRTRYFVRSPKDAPPEHYTAVYRIARSVVP